MKTLIPFTPAEQNGDIALAVAHQEMPVYPSEPGRTNAGGLLEYWPLIRHRKGTLILIACLGALIGLLVALPQTPVYEARASLEIQDMAENFLSSKQVNPVSDSGSSTSLEDIQTQIKILQSDTLNERVVEKLKVKTKDESSTEPAKLPAWRKALNLGKPDVEGVRERALGMAASNVKVRAAGQTRIVEILSDSTDPRIAAAFANTLANEFIEQNMEARWKMTERTGVWLTRQLDDMRVRLERSEDALQSYARQSGLMFTSEKNSVAEEKLRQLQEELSKAQSDRVARQSRYELANKAAAESLPDVLNDNSLREYQLKITDLRRQRADLVTVYTPNHTKIVRLDAELTALEAATDRERGDIIRRIQNDYEEALRREKLLSVDYAAQVQLVTGQSEKSIQYSILKREVDSNRQLYDAMLQKMKEASVASAMRASNVRVVDAAKVPARPYKPDVRANAGLGLISGIFGGIAFILIRERANRAVQEPGDSSFYLNIPELGVIPSETSERLKPFYYRSRPAIEAPINGDNGYGSRVELVTWQRKPSVIAESFRAVLTSILFSGNNGDRPKVLMLTSASPREGKTTVVSNLGIALAEIRQRVLLIDGDMRRPRLHEIFEIPNEQGLSTLLQERELTTQTLHDCIRETHMRGLFVLPSGPATSSAANLLHSDNMALLLTQLQKEFDMILIDTPPMLQMPDARVVGRLTGGVILIIRAGHTTRDAALAARQRFADDRTRVLGTILNDWNPKSSANGYYGYYSGYYNKGYHGYYGKDSDAA